MTETCLQPALSRGEFRVVYQPIVSLESGAIEGFEALVRWQHPEKGLLTPDQFIETAEQTGLIVPIGTFVLQTALHQLSHCEGRWMSVNVSKRQLMEPDLVQSVEDALQSSGIAANRLQFEIAEDVAVDDTETIATNLESLKKVGVRLSTNIFGTGQSSLSCRHRFSLDCLKIEREIINRIGRDPHDDAIVEAIVTLAHNLGLIVVAEGVETAKQVQRLQEVGCGLGQGYFFSRPVTPEALPGLLTPSLDEMTWTVLGARPASITG